MQNLSLHDNVLLKSEGNTQKYIVGIGKLTDCSMKVQLLLNMEHTLHQVFATCKQKCSTLKVVCIVDAFKQHVLFTKTRREPFLVKQGGAK